ncbi:hypothetical protein ACUWEX_00860 [Okibacterium fritillariae]|uniref:hypothetical protein n=1 Tax=Okibacterium fritillariae TaxID=123320 RepID=UPI0040556507
MKSSSRAGKLISGFVAGVALVGATAVIPAQAASTIYKDGTMVHGQWSGVGTQPSLTGGRGYFNGSYLNKKIQTFRQGGALYQAEVSSAEAVDMLHPRISNAYSRCGFTRQSGADTQPVVAICKFYY